MARKATARKRKKKNADQLGLLDARVATAPCVPGIREKVTAWREGNYKGISDTTRILLNYWFQTDHRSPDGRKFAYHYFQREAVETLIYLYEVAKVRRHKSLVETFATRSDLRLLQFDDFARYCVKMATGSGKTKAMSLVIAWQFFNAVAEARDDFAKTFLIIAPNVIVFERLRTDFEGGRIFRADPVIPPEMEIFWRDFQCYMRGEGERASSLGALYLTNVQQLYERQKGGQDEPEELTAVLGPKPPGKPPVSRISISASSTAADRWSWSTTRRTTRTMRKVSGTRSSAACTPRYPAPWPRSSISPPRRATARGSYFRGPSTTTRSSRRSSTTS
jgi:type III restriction enzyme